MGREINDNRRPQPSGLYLFKVQPRERGLFLPIPIDRYGHCNFNAADVLTPFGALTLIP